MAAHMLALALAAGGSGGTSLVSATSLSASPCTFVHGVDFYVPNGASSCSQPNATACCNFCSGSSRVSPVLPPSQKRHTPFFSWNSDGNGCYCKKSQGEHRNSSTITSGSCGPAPAPAPGPPPPPCVTSSCVAGCCCCCCCWQLINPVCCEQAIAELPGLPQRRR